MANRFYVGSINDDWNTNANWSTSSGGGGGASFPVAGDDVFFDANSGDCTLDANAECDAIDFTGYTATLNDGGFTLTTNGNIIIVSGAILSLSGTWLAKISSGDINFTHAGKTFNNLTFQNTVVGDRSVSVQDSGTWTVSGTFLLETTTANRLTFDNTVGDSTPVFNGLFDSNQTSTGLITFNIGGGAFTFKDNVDFSFIDIVNAATNSGFTFSPSSGTKTLTLRTSTTYVLINMDFKIENTTASNVTFQIVAASGSSFVQSGTFSLETTSTGTLSVDFDTDFSVQGTITITEGTGNIDFNGGTTTFVVLGSTFDFSLLSGGVVFASTGTLILRTQNNSTTVNFGTGTYGNVTFEDTGSTTPRTVTVNGSGVFTVLNDLIIDNAAASSTFTVDFAGNANPTITRDIDATVTTSAIQFNAGNGTWTCIRNVDLTGITLNPELGRFKFTRQSSNQNLTSDGEKFNEVEVTSFLGTVFLDIFKTAKLIANSSDSPQMIFEELVTHEVDALDLTGSDANRITLKSNLPGNQWKLLVLGNQVVNHVKVQDSDASPSANPIKAILSSEDDGNNINWQFGILDTQRILYDYGEALKRTTRILYDYIKFVPDNVRIIFNPYSQDSVRIDWSEFVPPTGYTGDIFYSVYIDGEAYEVDIDGSQTWIDLVGLVNLEDIIIDVVIQSRFGERFTFDFSSIGDRIKILFTESGDPNIARYVIFRDDGAGNIDLTKEFGEIIIKDRQDILNTSFVPESS